jgi:RND family efflux transporter MFP subunit
MGTKPTIVKIRLVCVAGAAIASILASACRKPVAIAPTPTVLVTEVVQKDVPIYSEWVGTTVGFVNAEIRPRVQGYLLKQVYQDGRAVKAGEILFQIDNRDYKAALDQAQGELAQQEANLLKNKQDLDRYRPLAAQGVISPQEFDHVDQATRASYAQVESAKAAVETAKLNLEWTQVQSPIEGIAGFAIVQVGDLVTPSTLLTSVSQVNPIKVNFPISEQEYLRAADRIKEHQATGRAKGEPDLELILGDGSVYKYPGRFYRVDREVNIQTGTIEVQGLFPNPDAVLRPGQYAKVRAANQTQLGALLVPQQAVQETQGQYQVAVVGTDNAVTLRNVKPGDRVGGLWIITDGVKAGERVITEGLQKVKDGMVVIAQPDPATEVSSPAPVSSPLPALQNHSSQSSGAPESGHRQPRV